METEQKDPQGKLKSAAYMFLLMIVISFLTDFFGKDRLFTLIATWAVGACFCWMLLRPKGFDKLGYPQQKALRWPSVAGVISALLLVTFPITKSLIEKKNLTAQEAATDLAKKAEQENIAAEQAKKDKLAWQGDNLAFRCSRKDLTVTTADGSEKLLEIFIQHDANNKRAKVYMTGAILTSEILDIEESDDQFDYDSSDLYVIDTRKSAQRTDPIAQRTFYYTVSGKRINELKLNRIDGKLKFEDSIDDEYSYLRTIDCKKIETAVFFSQTAALRDEAIEADRRAGLKEEAERAELKAKRQF